MLRDIVLGSYKEVREAILELISIREGEELLLSLKYLGTGYLMDC